MGNIISMDENSKYQRQSHPQNSQNMNDLYNSDFPASRKQVKSNNREAPRHMYREYKVSSKNFSRQYKGNKLDARNDPYHPMQKS